MPQCATSKITFEIVMDSLNEGVGFKAIRLARR